MKSSKKDFFEESEDLLEEAGRLLLEIQETSSAEINPDTINALFRAIHTMKGISGIFDFREITDFSHSFESLLDDIRLGRVGITEEAVRFLFRNLDILTRIVKEREDKGAQDVTDFIQAIESFRASARAGSNSNRIEALLQKIDASLLKVLTEYEEHRLKTNIKEGKGIYLGKTVFSFSDFDSGLKEIIEKIKKQGELVSTLPSSANVPADSIGFQLLFGSRNQNNELRKTLSIEIETLIPCRTETPKTAASLPGGARAPSLKSITTSVRVDIEKIDGILNTLSEITLTKSAIHRIASEMAVTYGHAPLVIDVFKVSQIFGKRVAELQEQILEIRMIPIGQIFTRLSQMVRRYAREMEKQIEFILSGEDTELDKYLAEEIVDPLMHIIRNSIDHGIETPEERVRAGKTEKGIITLRASQKGNHIVIEVKDDGAGIDREEVKRIAREKKIPFSENEGDEKDLLDLLFLPGFSTKSEVSEVSGRGVGLDVVKQKLSLFGGLAELTTEKGKGTTLVLTMPVTLAIQKALIVKSGQEKYAISLTSVSETLVIEHSELQCIEGREVYNLRGEMLPVMRIADIFGVEGNAQDRSFAVVIGYGERRIGLLVDELVEQHEIVIKSLGNYFKGLSRFTGAAETGRYEVILVIDAESLIKEFLVRQRVSADV
jgi:two-component system chemotaxis sensor kinase CheA